MFVFTAKLTKKKLVAGVVAAGLLLCGLILLISGGGGDRAASAPMEKLSGISTNEDRVAFLSRFGWTVSEEPAETQQILIPDTFEESLTRYNELQITQGFDLSKYKNKRIMRYSYAVENYPGAASDVFADLYIYKNTVIAGDLHSVSPDGFTQGLAGANGSAGESAGGGPCACEHSGDPDTPCTCGGCGLEGCVCVSADTADMDTGADMDAEALTEEDVYAEADAAPDAEANADTGTLSEDDWFE